LHRGLRCSIPAVAGRVMLLGPGSIAVAKSVATALFMDVREPP